MQQKRSICRSPTDEHYLSDVVGPVDCRSETAAMAELGREVVKVERSIVEGEFQTDWWLEFSWSLFIVSISSITISFSSCGAACSGIDGGTFGSFLARKARICESPREAI